LPDGKMVKNTKIGEMDILEKGVVKWLR